MKRVLACFAAFFLSICMIVPTCAFAEERNFGELSVEEKLNYIWNKLCNDVEFTMKYTEGGTATQDDLNRLKNEISSSVSSNVATESENGVKNYFNSKNTTSNKKGVEAVFSFSDMMISAANDQWTRVADAMKDVGGTNSWGFSLDIGSYNGSAAYNIFRSLGYSLVLVFFAVNLIETSIKYEIFTLKGGLMTFGRLMVSKAVIDLSGTVCIGVLNAVAKTAEDVLNLGTQKLEIHVPDLYSTFPFSDAWIVGDIIDVLLAVVMLIPVMLVALLALVTACLVSVKLILRSFELSLMVVVSPAFFACFSSEVTKPYFKNFVVTFIQVAVQVLFMAVVYYVGTAWIVSTTTFATGTDALTWFMSFLPNTLILIAMSIMMIKPPRVLTGLLR